MTPPALAIAIAHALKPCGILLDPCAGNGAFAEALRPYGAVWSSDTENGGFGFWSEHVDWIVTNPPWSQFTVFLVHALGLADHVAFLATVNHWWTSRRVRAVHTAGFGYRELLLVDWPATWPASGFQLGCMHVQRGYRGPLTVRDLP